MSLVHLGINIPSKLSLNVRVFLLLHNMLSRTM